MRALWRVALLISAAVLMAVVTVPPVVAQKGGFGGLLAEGTYQFRTKWFSAGRT